MIEEDNGNSIGLKGKIVRKILRGNGYGSGCIIFLCGAKGFGIISRMCRGGGGLRSTPPLEAFAQLTVLLLYLPIMDIILTICFVFSPPCAYFHFYSKTSCMMVTTLLLKLN